MHEVTPGQRWKWDKDAEDDECFVITGLDSDGNVSITYDYSGFKSSWHISSFDSDAVLIADAPENPELAEKEEAVQEENNQLSPNVYQFPNGVEVKDISAHLTSFGGQAVQYIARATRLDGVVKGLPVQDLYKAIELLKWEAERMEALQK